MSCPPALPGAIALLLALSDAHSETAYDVARCQTSRQQGPCLLSLVRSSRKVEELAGRMSSSDQKLAKDALEALQRSDPKDLDSRLELLLENAIASDAAGQNEELDEKYQAVCKEARSGGLTGRAGLLCSYAKLKIAMMGNDTDAVTGRQTSSSKQFLGHRVPEEKRAVGLATIEDVSAKLAKLENNAKQLPELCFPKYVRELRPSNLAKVLLVRKSRRL